MTELAHELLQIALQRKTELSRIPSASEWQQLYKVSEDHSIIGLMFGGIERLPKNQLPPMDLLMDWLGQTEYQKSEKDIFDGVLAEFIEFMTSEDIPYVVFKGSAVAAMYPNPQLRTIGDVDFYVPPVAFERCVDTLEQKLNVSILKSDVDKHYSFDWKELHFEMHYQMETFGCDKHQEYFNHLIDSYLGEINCFVDIKGHALPILKPTLDLILVYKHWMNHYIGEGVGLRQTTDLAVLVAAYQDKIDISELRSYLHGIGYLNGFDAMLALVDRYYDVKWPDYGSLKSSDYRYADRMMAEIMQNGNFGRSGYKYKDGSKKRAETTLRFFRHCAQCFWLAPKDILCTVPKRIAISLKAHRE